MFGMLSSLRGFLVSQPGLQKPAEFSEIRRKPVDLGWSEFQNRRITVHCFKILEKDKSQQKICKKTRSNFKVTSEEIFVKPSRLDW
jgi:hypothetical protein